MENLEELKDEVLNKINNSAILKELDDIRVAVLGKKGKLTEMMKSLGSLPLEEKISLGKGLNIVKSKIEEAIEAQKKFLEEKALNEKLKSETLDVTLPVRPETQGRIHPVSKIYEEVAAIFGQMGFEVAEGPDIEDQFHNFNALNMPVNHPARQMRPRRYGDKAHGGITQKAHVQNEKTPVRRRGKTYRLGRMGRYVPPRPRFLPHPLSKAGRGKERGSRADFLSLT